MNDAGILKDYSGIGYLGCLYRFLWSRLSKTRPKLRLA
jgi:hypothetical protein